MVNSADWSLRANACVYTKDCHEREFRRREGLRLHVPSWQHPRHFSRRLFERTSSMHVMRLARLSMYHSCAIRSSDLFKVDTQSCPIITDAVSPGCRLSVFQKCTRRIGVQHRGQVRVGTIATFD